MGSDKAKKTRDKQAKTNNKRHGYKAEDTRARDDDDMMRWRRKRQPPGWKGACFMTSPLFSQPHGSTATRLARRQQPQNEATVDGQASQLGGFQGGDPSLRSSTRSERRRGMRWRSQSAHSRPGCCRLGVGRSVLVSFACQYGLSSARLTHDSETRPATPLRCQGLYAAGVTGMPSLEACNRWAMPVRVHRRLPPLDRRLDSSQSNASCCVLGSPRRLQQRRLTRE
jgi:hypothetical protein